MEFPTPTRRGADAQETSAFPTGEQSWEGTALRAVRGQDALAPGTTPVSGGIPERGRPALDWNKGMRLPSASWQIYFMRE